jgi:hypothetical protein
VYKNLNRPGYWSIQCRGRVIAYAQAVHLVDVRQVIQRAGLERMLTDNRRAVCVKLEGVITGRAANRTPDAGLAWRPFTDNGRAAARRQVVDGCRRGFMVHQGADVTPLDGRTVDLVQMSFADGHAVCGVYGAVE